MDRLYRNALSQNGNNYNVYTSRLKVFRQENEEQIKECINFVHPITSEVHKGFFEIEDLMLVCESRVVDKLLWTKGKKLLSPNSIDMKKYFAIKKMNYSVYVLLSIFHLFTALDINAQTSHKVLFLGNSYTGVNNLPQLVYDVALSAGDTLIFDSRTPGGYKLIDHSVDINSQNKIINGGWDYVVIQGQSQEPILMQSQFVNGGLALYNLIKQHNPCAVTMPYMTWGRKNGDASNCAAFPVMCTYQSMDSVLKTRYLDFTDQINGEVSPVSVVWNYLRQNHPNIDLYQSDESHPSAAGSYAAACCFYVSIFKKDPTLIAFDFGLDPNFASAIRNAVKLNVYDSLQLWDYKKPPVSNISYQIGSGINQVLFNAINQNVQQNYFWDFGDGITSNLKNPTHSFLNDGAYTVSLTTTNCDLQGLNTSISDTVIQFCNHTPIIYTSHPWLCKYDTLWTQAADSYQWFENGVPLPENNQYLADYGQYNISGFSVISSINGCSELSEIFTETPEWSGYYFDAIGDPCVGDTVAFAVLHISGYLNGSETILWYENDIHLPFMDNKDTLFISTSGKFECKVINPNSNCPLDTTSYLIEYDCEGVSIEESLEDEFWTVFPNPTSETITIKFVNPIRKEQVQIYNSIGLLLKVIEITEETNISVADLPNGLYFIRLKNNKQPLLKFIKH